MGQKRSAKPGQQDVAVAGYEHALCQETIWALTATIVIQDNV